jgi:hypothetical protein
MKAPRAPHPFGCTGTCCQPSSSRTDERRSSWPPVAPWAAAVFRSSGPPRTGESERTFATPEKPPPLARSLPIDCDKSAAPPSAPSPTSVLERFTITDNDVVGAACRLLDRVVGECYLSAGAHAALRPEQVYAPIFHSVSVPGLSGGEYLVHHLLRLGLARKEHLAEAVVLHAFLLIDRLLQRDASKGFHLCTRNVHRVLLATVLVSAKLLDDECYNNHYWASVGGVTLQHLNQLELEVMCLLDFEVLVTATMIDAARARLLTTSS